MKHTFITSLILFTICNFSCFGQSSFTFIPLKDDDAELKIFSDAITNQYNKDIASLSGENKKHIADAYKERYDFMMKQLKDKDILISTDANNYLQSILTKITEANPELANTPIHLAFIRDYWPNAGTIGEGMIVFNIGLFNRLQNESQVCFTLCHELAHDYLRHNDNKIIKDANTLYSQEFQKELKNIKNSDYGQKEKVESLAKNFVFTNRRHSREFEEQADSLGLEFMKRTLFDTRESLTCLALLDTADNDKYDVKPPVEKIFNYKEYPFQQNWISENESSLSMMAKANEGLSAKELDSLKTHPDCKKRIIDLSTKANEYYKTTQHKNPVNDSVFEKLKRQFDYEIIEYCYNSGNVSLSLYYSLQMLQTYPSDIYLITNTGRCFNTMFSAQKNHEFGKITDFPSPYAEKKYNEFLKFTNKLRLHDISAIGYYYMSQFSQQFSADSKFKEQLDISIKNFNSP